MRLLTTSLMRPLSPRLEMLARLLEPCSALADIGTDHAYLAIGVVSRGLARRAWAIDLREAPLEGARRHVREAGLEERVTLLCGDGLRALGEREADAVTIAGMSGESMVAILEAGRERLSARRPEGAGGIRQIVVQPNQNAHLVRAWALAAGLWLKEESLLESGGRFFLVCDFRAPGSGAPESGGRAGGDGGAEAGVDPAYSLEGFSPAELCHLGPVLLRRKDPVARRYFEAQRERLTRWVAREPARHTAELARWTAACAHYL